MAAGDNIRKNTEEQKLFNEAIFEGKMAYREYEDIFKSIQTELGKKNNLIKDANNSYQQLISASSKLKLGEEDITRLTDKQLKNLKEKADAALKDLRYAANKLSTEKQSLILNENGNNLAGDALDSKLKELLLNKQITSQEASLLRAKATNFELEQDMVDKAGEDVKKREKLNEVLGITGNSLKFLNGLAGSFAGAFKLDKVQKDMEKFAEDAIKAGKNVSRLQTLSVGLVSAFKNLGDVLTDPAVVISALVKGFNEVDKAATDFQRQTGQDLNTLNTSLEQFNGGLITSAEYIKAASDLTQEFGLNAAAVFTSEDLSEAASMTKEMGLAGKEAANLARLSKINGGNIESQNEAIVAGINSANKQNKTAVAHGKALRDVANTSEGIAISYAGYPEKLGAAATAAAGLGMSLADVDKIAGSLLDFQSSIEAEMEAELLTGRQLNLEKARQLALDNDLEGVAKELANQGITSANFSKMNRIQQEAQAKALGMSRDEMARMLLQQQIGNDLSGEGLNAAQKATLEDLKRVDAQEKFATAIGKLQQALAPIVGLFADIVSNSKVIYGTMAIALLAKLPSLTKGVMDLAGGFKDALSNVKDLTSGIFKMATGKGTDKLKDTLLGKAGDKTKEIQESAQGVEGEGPGGFLKSLGEGLKSIGEDAGKVIAGGGALLLSAPGLIAIGLAAPALAILSLINGEALEGVLSGLGKGLASLGEALMGPQLLGLAAGLALLTGSIIGIGFALKLAAPAFEAIGTIITSIFGGIATVITSVAEGFTMMFGAINSDNIGALLLLGPALLGISTGLISVAATGLLALPVIGALTALGTVSGALGSMFGDNENSTNQNEDKGSMKAVEKKLDELIAVISAGGDVYIDGSKVGKTVALATSNLG